MSDIDVTAWHDVIVAMRVWITEAALSFARGFGAFLLFPMFVGQPFPPQLRTAIPFACLPITLAALHGHTGYVPETDTVQVWGWLVAELMLGMVLALPVGVLFWGAQSAGEMLDIKTGANYAAVFGAAPGTPEGPAQTLMVQLAVLSFLAHQGFHRMVEALWKSYQAVPVGQYGRISLQALPGMVVDTLGSLMAVVVHLFGSLFIVMLLAEFAVAMAGRLAPQLQVSNISAPAKSLLLPLLLLVLVQVPWFLGGLGESVWAGLERALGVLR